MQGIDGMDWRQLQEAVSVCQACPLCKSRKNTVFGVGQAAADPPLAPQVDWLVVGEAPGENEDRSGEPFVGQAGQLLDNMLKAMGVSRSHNVFVANVIKCRPPGNRNPEAQEIAQCEPYLRRQIELLQPKIILAMGRFAVNSLLQATVPDVAKLPLGKLRGQVHSYSSGGRSVPVVATYHPAYLLRNLPEKAKAWADLCLAMAEMRRR
jgi:DNA polymerase